jgi:hypothetical protein
MVNISPLPFYTVNFLLKLYFYNCVVHFTNNKKILVENTKKNYFYTIK